MLGGIGRVQAQVQPEQPVVVDTARASKDTSLVFGQVRRLMGLMTRFSQQSRYDSAMRAGFEVYRLMQPYKSNALYAEGAWRYADIARSLHRYREGLWSLNEALRHTKSDLWRARLYNRMGGLYFEDAEPDSALYFTRLSMSYPLQGQAQLTFYNEWQLGAIMRNTPAKAEAVAHLRRALVLLPAGDTANAGTILTHLGLALEGLGRRQAALDTLALAYRETIRRGTHAQEEFASESYWRVLLAAGRQAEALTVLNRYLLLRDSIRLEESNATVALLQAREQISKQQAQNAGWQEEKVKQESRVRLALLGGLGALLLAGVMAAFYLTARRQKRMIASQNDILFVQQAELEGQKAALEQLNASKDALLSVVSHDVRGPLITLGTTLQLLSEGHLSEQETKPILEGLAGRVRDTETLLNDVLLWTKGQMSGIYAVPVRLDPAKLVEEVLTQSSPLLHSQHVSIEKSGTAQPMLADPGLLKVVLRNLLSNAIRYGPKRGKVVVRFVSTVAESGLSVIDQGTGLPAELVERILSKEGTVLPTRALLSLGGLGLVLVKDFVERQSGRIQIETSTKGTAMTVWLPRA